jgi:hypothetical protein
MNYHKKYSRSLRRKCKYFVINNNNLQILIIILLLGTMTILLGVNNSSAQRTTLATFPPGSKPFGLTYGEWSAKWWQWLYSLPTGSNPSTDVSGKNCNLKQDNPKVWFLAGTSGGFAERKCTIPAGVAILISPIEGECSFAENPSLHTKAELLQCVKADQNAVRDVRLTVDGVSLDGWRDYRISSDLFNLTLPENNIIGVSPQKTQAVSDGYFIMLKPLPIGEHTVYSSGNLIDVTTTGTLNFASQVKYHLSVKGPQS